MPTDGKILQRLRENDPTLVELDLSQQRITDKDVAELCEALIGNQTLRVLNLAKNKIGDKGAGAIATMLEQNWFLRELDLSENSIKKFGAYKLREAFDLNITLQSLKLEGNPIKGKLKVVEPMCTSIFSDARCFFRDIFFGLSRNKDPQRVKAYAQKELLWQAIYKNNLAVVDRCIRDFVEDINAVIDEEHGGRPLGFAAMFADISIINRLLQEPDIDLNIEGAERDTPLISAMRGKNIAVFKRFLDHPGLNVNLPHADYGTRPIQMAIYYGRYNIVEILLDAPGIDLFAMDDAGRTVIHYAACSGDNRFFDLLITRKPELKSIIFAEDFALKEGIYGGRVNRQIERKIQAIKQAEITDDSSLVDRGSKRPRRACASPGLFATASNFPLRVLALLDKRVVVCEVREFFDGAEVRTANTTENSIKVLSLVRFLEHFPDVLEIARSSYLLRIICKLWNDKVSDNALEIAPFTPTEIYQEIFNQIICNDFRVYGAAFEQQIINSLGYLAFSNYNVQKHEFQFEDVKAAWRKSGASIRFSAFLMVLLNTNILQKVSDVTVQEEALYKFSHKRLQEYFAALYWINLFFNKTHVLNPLARKFLERHRLSPSYEQFWGIVSGILSERDAAFLNEFFTLMFSADCYPPDLTEWYGNLLLIRCLTECRVSAKLANGTELLAKVSKWINDCSPNVDCHEIEILNEYRERNIFLQHTAATEALLPYHFREETKTLLKVLEHYGDIVSSTPASINKFLNMFDVQEETVTGGWDEIVLLTTVLRRLTGLHYGNPAVRAKLLELAVKQTAPLATRHRMNAGVNVLAELKRGAQNALLELYSDDDEVKSAVVASCLGTTSRGEAFLYPWRHANLHLDNFTKQEILRKFLFDESFYRHLLYCTDHDPLSLLKWTDWETPEIKRQLFELYEAEKTLLGRYDLTVILMLNMQAASSSMAAVRFLASINNKSCSNKLRACTIFSFAMAKKSHPGLYEILLNIFKDDAEDNEVRREAGATLLGVYGNDVEVRRMIFNAVQNPRESPQLKRALISDFSQVDWTEHLQDDLGSDFFRYRSTPLRSLLEMYVNNVALAIHLVPAIVSRSHYKHVPIFVCDGKVCCYERNKQITFIIPRKADEEKIVQTFDQVSKAQLGLTCEHQSTVRLKSGI
jgi:hypothetical protein